MRRPKPKVVRSLVKTALGPLEDQVMRAVCGLGEATVRDVVQTLHGRFAYTTVMTTMDRLYQKGLLRRETGSKAYVYHPVMTVPQFETQVARDLITAFLACREASSGLLASALVDAVAAYNARLLDEVENEILSRRSKKFSLASLPEWPSATYDWPLGSA